MLFWLSWILVWLGCFFIRSSPKWLFPAIGIALLVVFRDQPPAERLFASSLMFLYLMKAAALTTSLKPIDRAIYFSVWPGMDAENLAKRAEPEKGTGKRFGQGLSVALLGLGAIFLLTVFPPKVALGWLGIASILLTVHFGVSQVLTAALQIVGRPVKPLFNRPLSSQTLSDFWTRRWNLPYVDMNRRLFMPWLTRRFGIRGAVFATFIISGLLHEMAISYPAGAGYGTPLLYFAIQGIAVLAEKKLKIRSRIFTWVVVLAPLPLLFHAAFRHELIEPLFVWLNHIWLSQPIEWYVSALLWIVGGMQFAVLLASRQVPARLNWNEELARLSPFNRKLMWTYGIFIVVTIVSFGILTFALHNSFLKGETAAIGLAIFMSAFWILRLVFDSFYFKSEDWPAGEDLQAGHALLNALFVFLAGSYAIAAIWATLK